MTAMTAASGLVCLMGLVAVAAEPWRPQFHFTPPRGWCNDPNGLSYRDGEWHLFYQHNPCGTKWGNIHWGHAVSRDLLCWRDLGDALAPDAAGMAFSGSAVTDFDNTAGFGHGAHVLVYTADDNGKSTQRIAWSLDGRSYRKWPKAVIESRPDARRDPKVFWYAPGRHWTMAIYGTFPPDRHGVSFFASKDLKVWEKTGQVAGDKEDEGRYLYECPDLFELPVDGEGETRWILTGGNRQYAIGTFDGRTFRPEVERLEQHKPLDEPNPVYAWQTFDGAPDGRRIQIAWEKFDPPNAFRDEAVSSQGMTLPMELKLIRTPAGLRLARIPARELEALRDGESVLLAKFDGELAEVEFSCVPVADARVVFDLRGVKVEYRAAAKTLSVGGRAVAWDLDAGGVLGLRVFVDRVGIEVFSLDGLQYLPAPHVFPTASRRDLSWSAYGAKNPVRNVEEKAWRLKYGKECHSWEPRQ